MSKGLGRVQRDILSYLADWHIIFTKRTYVYTWVDAHKVSVARGIKSLLEGGYIIENEEGELKISSRGLGYWADNIADTEII
jgi:hypothetical protein